MFCQNCGTKNNDTSIFCENCGVKLEKPIDFAPEQNQPAQSQPEQNQPAQSQPEQNQPAQSQPAQSQPEQNQPAQNQQIPQQGVWQPSQPKKQKQPRKPFPKIWIAVAVEAVVLIAAVLIFFKVGNNVYSPQKVAEKFFVEVANHNFEEAYKTLDVEENDFINEENFEKASCNVELSKVTNYEIKRVSGSGLGREVKISYRTKGSSSDKTYVVSITKKTDKNALFFENWEVSPDSMIVEDFSVVVPVGAEVTVDGVKLGDDYKDKRQKDDGYYQYFSIPEIFAGEHQVVVTKEGMQEVRRLVDTDVDYSFWLDSMSVDEATLEEVFDTAVKDFQTIYESAAAGADFDTVADLFSAEEECQEEAREDYEDLVADFQPGSYSTINRVAFSNLEGDVYEWSGSMEVDLDFDYVVDYTYEDWFGETNSDSYESTDYMYLELVYEDGKWVLTGFSGAYLYY